MPNPIVNRRTLSGSKAYWKKYKKIFGSNVLALFPMWDLLGTIMTDQSGNNRNGAYSASGVTYGVDGIGDGKTAISLAGAGYASLLTAGLSAAFNPLEFTLLCFGKTDTWADGITRTLMALGVDASNYALLNKTGTANTLAVAYVAGGTNKTKTITASPSTFFSLGMTVSKSNDRMIGYYNGSAFSTPATSLGTWAGSLATARCNIGVRVSPSTELWSGSEAYAAIINGEATAAQMSAIASLLG